MQVDAQSIAIAVAALAGVAVGAFAAWRAAKSGERAAVEAAAARAQAEAAPEVARLAERASQLAHSLEETRIALDAERRDRAAAEAEAARLRTALAEVNVTLEGERKGGEEKLALLRGAQEDLSNRFKVLADQILDEKSQKFAEQNKTALGALLDPLRTQLSEFKGKVEEVYVQEGKDRSALAEQVKHLMTLNKTLSQDAQNLTDALKGNAQVQGAWGEWVLEEMLTSSGLMKGEHYLLQDSRQREDGTRGRPDALINLPGERQLVLDSKVSLVAYEQYSSAKTDDERAIALRGHLESMRRHISGLSDREYQKMYPTMDFVMMFIPMEPAFMLAAANDKQLFAQAWEKNVLLVSPSTLLFVLRTVAYLWRQEDQNRNAQAIADRGAKLYDKFCDFVKDLEEVGQRLKQAQNAYGDARNKLSEGNGNLVSQAQKLTSLGVKGSKKLPPGLLQFSNGETDVAEELAAIAAGNTPREADSPPAAPAE
jgi:DNA recombination protein RmuC